MNKLNARISFLRDKRHSPIGCIAIYVDHAAHIAEYQLSVLNPMDRFCRPVARQLALGRLIEQPITVLLPKDATMHDISSLIMNDIIVRGIAPSRAIKAAKLWLNNKMLDEQERANILADFTDILNSCGIHSEQLHDFRIMYLEDRELQKLFNAAITVQQQLRQTHANILTHRNISEF